MTYVVQPDELATLFREINRRLRSLESGNNATFVLGGSFYQLVDATYSARCRFLVPPTTIHVGKAALNFSLQPFRAAIQSATGGGSTSGSEGSHTHGVSWGDHSHGTPGHSHGTPNHNHLLLTLEAQPLNAPTVHGYAAADYSAAGPTAARGRGATSGCRLGVDVGGHIGWEVEA